MAEGSPEPPDEPFVLPKPPLKVRMWAAYRRLLAWWERDGDQSAPPGCLWVFLTGYCRFHLRLGLPFVFGSMAALSISRFRELGDLAAFGQWFSVPSVSIVGFSNMTILVILILGSLIFSPLLGVLPVFSSFLGPLHGVVVYFWYHICRDEEIPYNRWAPWVVFSQACCLSFSWSDFRSPQIILLSILLFGCVIWWWIFNRVIPQEQHRQLDIESDRVFNPIAERERWKNYEAYSRSTD